MDNLKLTNTHPTNYIVIGYDCERKAIFEASCWLITTALEFFKAGCACEIELIDHNTGQILLWEKYGEILENVFK